MEIVILAKQLSDYSLYFMFASFFGSWFSLDRVMLLPAFVFAASGLLCWVLRKKSLPLRLAPLLLMAVCFIYAKRTVEYAVLLPPAVYNVAVAVKKLYAVERGDAVSVLRFGLILGAILSVIAAAFIKLDEPVRGTMLFLFIFALSTVMLIRLLRFDPAALSSHKLKLINLITFVVVCAIALLLSSKLVLSGISSFFGLVFKYVISPVFVWIVHGLGFIVKGIGSLLSRVELRKQSLDRFGKDVSAESLNLVNEGDEQWGGAKYIVWALTALLIIIIVGAAVLIFRKLIAGKYKESRSSGGELSENSGRSRIRGKTARGAREQVREYYRRFLVLCSKRGIKIKRSDTSLDIENAASGTFDDKRSAEMRDIYLRARYDDKAEIKHTDVKAMKELYGAVKSEKE